MFLTIILMPFVILSYIMGFACGLIYNCFWANYYAFKDAFDYIKDA